VKKVKSVALDASLLAEAEKEAERRGITFSALVEEALKRLLRQEEAWRGVEEKLTNIETLLRQCLEETRKKPPESRPAQKDQAPPPQLNNNLWINILRRRG
jgi:post-segregation antitoxin (ccd killing protein)